MLEVFRWKLTPLAEIYHRLVWFSRLASDWFIFLTIEMHDFLSSGNRSRILTLIYYLVFISLAYIQAFQCKCIEMFIYIHTIARNMLSLLFNTFCKRDAAFDPYETPLVVVFITSHIKQCIILILGGGNLLGQIQYIFSTSLKWMNEMHAM